MKTVVKSRSILLAKRDKATAPRLRSVTLDIFDGALANGHDGPAKPPTEFRIFRAGVNPSEKGDFIFDESAAKSVMEHMARYANRIVIDYCHCSLSSRESPNPAEAGKAAGWFTPALRGEELWATDVAWTAQAAGFISQREYAYFSPAFNVDQDERVVELTNVALTNIPAMHDLEQLVAASRSESMKVQLSKEDLKKSIHELHEKIHGAMHDDAAKAILDAKLDGMKQDELKAYHEKLSALFPPKDDGDGDEGKGGKGDGDGDEAKKPAADDADKKADTKADDDDDDAEEHAKKGDEGKEMSKDAPLMARIVELENKLAARDKAVESDRRSAMLDRAREECKLSPADLSGESDTGKFIKTLSNEQLASYLRTKSKAVNTEETPLAPGRSGTGRTFNVSLAKDEAPTPVTLSSADIEIARVLGNSLDKVAKQRARELARRRVS